MWRLLSRCKVISRIIFFCEKNSLDNVKLVVLGSLVLHSSGSSLLSIGFFALPNFGHILGRAYILVKKQGSVGTRAAVGMFVQPVRIKASYSSPANFMDVYGFLCFFFFFFVLLVVVGGALDGTSSNLDPCSLFCLI